MPAASLASVGSIASIASRAFFPRIARRVGAAASIATALAAVAFVGLGSQGCSSGGGEAQYRCDATGCFECDGYGCTPVSGPTPTPCSLPGDPLCTGATKCTDVGCLPTCKADADCAKGTVCRAIDSTGVGFCAAPTGADPTLTTCTVAKDCGASGMACVDGKCVADTGCTGASCSCKFSSDCGDGRICVDGACEKSCDATTACPSGSSCGPLGTCIPSGTLSCGSAAAGATCKSDEHCFDGHCTSGCTADGDCKTASGARDPGLRCVGGACAPNDAPVTTCAGATECASSQKCVDGFCRFLCGSDDECKSHDARIGACSLKEGICRAPSDLAATCTAKADCAGKDCVDGQCK